MVAVAETAFRRAWLEVRYGGREKITVTLGPEPVKVGSDAKACTVWARGAPPVAMRFFVRDGQVVCDDLAAGRELVVGDGFEKEVGTLVVTVRTGGSGKGGSGRARSQPRRERAARKPEVEPLSLDDVDDLNLPMPPSVPAETPAPARQATPPARPAPAPPKPPVPGGSKPPAPAAKPPVPRPVIPPVAPAIKSTATRPDGCPGCGRAVPGKPGARYCMICDQTF
jgi:hypothetical protein